MKALFKLFLLMAVVFASCKKNMPEDASGHVIVKGSIKLEISVMHHTWPVSGLSVFLKKDETQWPGKDTTLYNYRTTTDGGGVAVFPNLVPGNYYVYATGYDSYFAAQVIGYGPVVLNSTTVSNNEADITLLVSE